MITWALFFIAIALLGLIVGVGVLIHQETEWYRNFMHKRPILGWTFSFLIGAAAWYAVAYAVFYGLLFILTLLLGHVGAPSMGPTQ